MLTAADCPSSERNDQQFPFFKVMIIVVAQEPMHYDLYTYSSSGELGWKVCSSNAAEAGHAIQVTLFQHNAAISHGDAYWFFRSTSGSYIICSSTKTGQVITAKVVNTRLLGDPTYDEPFLSIHADGRLVFLFLRIDGTRLDIYFLRFFLVNLDLVQSCNNSESIKRVWRKYSGTNSHIMLQPPSQRIGQGVVYECLGEKNAMLILMDNHKRIYIADIKTGVMQEITDCPRGHGLSRREIVPLEMDWPALFISRLGGVAT
jgi:hypothetical protein